MLAEIAEIERYLVDVPPHSGGGHRDALIAKLAELRRELARLDREGGPDQVPPPPSPRT